MVLGPTDRGIALCSAPCSRQCSLPSRRRSILQSCFFPSTFRNVEPAARLKPGDMRTWTGLKVFIELRDGVTLHVPFREASKASAIAVACT